MLLYQFVITIYERILSTFSGNGKFVTLQLWSITDNAVLLINILLTVMFLFLVVILLGLSIFYIIWAQQWRKSPITPMVDTLTPPTPSDHSPQLEKTSLDHEYFLIPFQRVLEKRIPNPKKRKKPLSTAHVQKNMQRIITKWQKSGQLDQLVTQALEVLFDGAGKWYILVQLLQILQFSSDQIEDYRQQALEAIQKIRVEKDPVIVEDLCCKVLILYTIIRPSFYATPERQAAIDFDMGLAFVYLAKDLSLLSLAKQSYNNAERFFQRQSISSIYFYPYLQTQISLGDISLAYSLLEEERKGHYLKWALDWYTNAAKLYTQSLSVFKQYEHIFHYETDESIIDERMKKIQEQLSEIQARPH